jgi:micrococcal nuclease
MSRGLPALILCVCACDPGPPPPAPVRPPPLARPARPALAPPPDSLAARVRSVYDGDTLTLETDQKVRLLGIDTPELKGADGSPEPFAVEARDLLRRLCEGREVRLEFDAERQDRYGRWLCFVHVRDGGEGRMANAEMLLAGLARVYTPGPNAKHKELLLDCQREARQAGRGSWKDYVLAKPRSVVVTKSGHAYHRPGCEGLKNAKEIRSISEQEALDLGRSACRMCKP